MHSLPKTKSGKWAMGFGLETLLVFPILGMFAAFIRPIIDKASMAGRASGGNDYK